MIALSLLLSLCIYSLYFLTAVLAAKVVLIAVRRRQGKDVCDLVGTSRLSVVPVVTAVVLLPVCIVGADALGQRYVPGLAENHVFALLGFAAALFLTACVWAVQRRIARAGDNSCV